MENAKTIFDQISTEVPLLKKLIDRGNLFFVGDEETIHYLREVFEKRNTHSSYDYYCWHENLENFDGDRNLLSNNKTIIIASVDNEHIIFDFIQNELTRLGIKTLVLKLFSDIFANLTSGQDLFQVADRELVTPKISYAIATTPRSGSTALSNALAATEIAGFPKEHLRLPSRILTQNCHFDYVRYLQILMTYQKTENEVFGTKFIGYFFQPHYQTNFDFNRILKSFKFIYLVRRDKVAQATSLFMAQKTKTWHIASNQKNKDYQEKLSEVAIEDSDLAQIHSYHKLILSQEKFWETFFEQNHLSPLAIEYEQFVKSQEEQINQVLKYLEIIDRDKIKILNSYQHKIYKVVKKLKLIENNSFIGIVLKNKKIQSDLSKVLIQKYKEKYS